MVRHQVFGTRFLYTFSDLLFCFDKFHAFGMFFETFFAKTFCRECQTLYICTIKTKTSNKTNQLKVMRYINDISKFDHKFATAEELNKALVEELSKYWLVTPEDLLKDSIEEFARITGNDAENILSNREQVMFIIGKEENYTITYRVSIDKWFFDSGSDDYLLSINIKEL